MKKTTNYESPRLLRVIPLFLGQGICNSPTGNGAVNTTGHIFENHDFTDFESKWQ